MSTVESTPRWQRVIERALEEDKTANVYQLATIDSTSNLADRAGGTIPRARSLIHRDFLSPRSATHPILLTTTDARTSKATQLSQNARVEIAWWLPKPQEQMRISGIAYVYPAPDFTLSGVEDVPAERKKQIEDAVAKLRSSFPGKELCGDGFDWENERRTRFDGMSGHMRASWVRPVPDSRLADPSEAKKWPESLPKLGEAGDKKPFVEAALRNFALVVIDPLEVDYVELGVIPNRRTRFFKDGEVWKEEALVP